MVPFLAQALEEILRCLMGYFISPSTLQAADTRLKLVKVDVSVEGGKCLRPAEIKLPTASKAMLKKLTLSADAKLSFLKQFRDLLIGMVQKLQERSPFKYCLVRSAAAFDPILMVESKSNASNLFGGIADAMYEQNRLTCNEGDNAKAQFDDFLATVVRTNIEHFSNFDFSRQRLDEFLTVYLLGV